MRLKWKILIGFAVNLSVFIALLAFSFSSLTKMLDARKWTLHSHRVIEKTDNLLSDILTIEMARSAFAITGDEKFLRPLTSAIDAFQSHFDSLTMLTRDNPLHQATLRQLHRHYSDWLRTGVNPLLDLRRAVNAGSERFESVIEFIDSGKGDVHMDALRSSLDEIKVHESNLLDERQATLTELTRTTKRLLLFGGITGVFLGILISFFTAWHLTGPIEKAVAYAKRVEDGDYSSSLGLRRKDEIGILASALESMVHELTHHIALLNARAADLKKLSNELYLKNRELEDFAFIASHDLQEPLRKIQAFGDRLKLESGDRLGPKGTDFLERMVASAGRMQNLILAILDYSRILRKKAEFTRVDLNRIFVEVQDDLSESVLETSARIEADTLPTIDADAAQMRQLFQNILSNALKFHRLDTPPRIVVHSTCESNGKEEEQCEIRFSDNGIGFEEKYMDKIFTAFQRLHGKKEYPGTGMGLTICRSIVVHHHGTITAESTPGRGTTFIVKLPVHQAETGTQNSFRHGLLELNPPSEDKREWM